MTLIVLITADLLSQYLLTYNLIKENQRISV